jgi:hypothetical protein
VVAEAAPTAVADVPIAVDALAVVLVSNAVALAAQGMTVVIREAVLLRLGDRSSFPKC